LLTEDQANSSCNDGNNWIARSNDLYPLFNDNGSWRSLKNENHG
jgi:hypothetical protein